MSMPTMSAPSAASASACDLPCPRAAPVINATFPSSCPIARLPRSEVCAQRQRTENSTSIQSSSRRGETPPSAPEPKPQCVDAPNIARRMPFGLKSGRKLELRHHFDHQLNHDYQLLPGQM